MNEFIWEEDDCDFCGEHVDCCVLPTDDDIEDDVFICATCMQQALDQYEVSGT